MKARAAVLRQPDQPFALEEIDLAEPGPGDVLVRIVGVGMCHTDLLARSTPKTAATLPAVFGHEGSGVVERTGPGVSGLSPGDHVVLSFDSCGACVRCRSGMPSYCAQFGPRNTTGLRADGSTGAEAGGSPIRSRWFGQSSFATHAVATERNAVRVDRDLPLELLGPLGCGVQTGAGSILLGLGVRAGASVVIFGAGAVGLSAVMAAALTGARSIVAVDLHAGRRELATDLGATHTVDGAADGVVELIKDATGGGAAFALDTTAVPAVSANAVASLASGGVCGLVGAGGGELTLAPNQLSGRYLTYLLEGNAVPQLFIPQLIEHWQHGRLPFDRLVRTYPLEEINDAERDSRSGETIKPILVP